MKILLQAKEDINERIGDKVFTATTGETLELTASDAEIALSTGSFDILEEVNLELKTKVQELLKNTKEVLVSMAEELQIENASNLNKEPLATTIATKQLEGETK